jgi:hypothetical protein
MRPLSQSRLNILRGILGALLTASAPAHAQDLRDRSLGGYGASASDPGTGMGMTGGTVIPYNGSFGGFMPARMGGTGSLSFQPFARSEVEPNRPVFRLSPMTGGTASMSRGFSPSLGTPGAAGMRGMAPTFGTTRMGVMPPSFGYPFRQPPSLLDSSSTGLGMSM